MSVKTIEKEEWKKRNTLPLQEKICNYTNKAIENAKKAFKEHERIECDIRKEEEKRTVFIYKEMINSGVGRRFINASLENYIPKTQSQEKALSWCKEYCKSKRAENGDGVLFTGPVKGGKTHLLIAILRECAISGLSIKYITAEEFFIGLRSAIDSKSGEKEYLQSLISPRILILDDLHMIAEGESYQYRSLWYLLDKRYFNANATLVATNRDLDEFRKIFDDRTRRRLEAKVVYVDSE